MSIEKGLYAAPQGIMEEEGEPLEIEIEDPEAVRIRAGDLEIDIEKDYEEEGFEDNLAEYIDDSELALIASELVEAYEDDVSARKDWGQT